MTRMVFCKKYKQELAGLTNPPIPGDKGIEIFEQFSEKAWLEWTDHQTRLINEKHLNMMDKDDRKFLTEQRDKFFAGEDFVTADGYVPENNDK